MLLGENLTFLSPLLKIDHRLLQVLIGNGTAMTDEVVEEPTVESQEEEVPELTLEERQQALKRSRWNVFMYLGIAALLFAFALYPFVNTSLEVDQKKVDFETGYLFGAPIAGEDFSDIPADITISVNDIPADTEKIEVFVVEADTCSDFTVADVQEDLYSGKSEFPNWYWMIENPKEGKVYEEEFVLDPGTYCIEVFIDGANQKDVIVDIDIYPTQKPLAALGVICLLMSAFAFIGAQKNGKFVKNLIEPKPESVEQSVLSQTSSERISAGPSGPPTAAGPTGPPAAGPTGPPVETAVEPAPEVAPAEQPAIESPIVENQDVYEDQGNGWFFRKLPDGTYDQTVYTVVDGQYVPYVDPNA